MNDWGAERLPFVFIIDYAAEKPILFRLDELEKSNFRIHLPSLPSEESSEKLKDFTFIKHPVSYEQYKKAFDLVHKAIIRGDTFLLNLTFPTRIQTNLTLEQIFQYSKAPFKLQFRKDFVVFSPEAFITIHEDIISGYPMKGTVDASLENAEEILMNDPKEIAEHNTIVDLIRNDLSMVAKKVRVKKFRYIDRIQTHEKVLLQTSSEITGELTPNWHKRIGDILFRMLPAGSISGAPKQKTMEIIHEAERYDRGYFSGIFGYFDGNNLDSAVMIRFIEKQGNELIFKSGGGITSFSECEKEYRELIEKVYVPIVRND
ncbi:MAG: aminodeoxychorismate synthase component I [Bacteroidetes bacterium]|nr:aminodeoxychorismate synthase component I [Bacteroidota bacterium]